MSLGLIGIFFFLLIGLSKEFIILNAEALVAMCFVLFVYVVTVYLKDTISSTLEEKALSLQKEFDQCFTIEKQQVSVLVGYYTKQLGFLPKLENLFVYLKETHRSFLSDVSLGLRDFYISYIRHTLGELKSSEEHVSRIVHGYFVNRLYVSCTHFVSLLPAVHKKFPTSAYKQYFIRSLVIFRSV